nr:hypothetical protein [Tanacetum cinerariifolium]
MHPIYFRFEYIMVEHFKGIQTEGYTNESKPMYYNYLRPLTSQDEGLYALACEEDVRRLETLDRSFKLIEVYIEHNVTAVDSYRTPPPWVIEDVIRQLSFEETKLDGEAGFGDVAGNDIDNSGLSYDESFRVDDLNLNVNEHVGLNVSQAETQSKVPVFEVPVYEEPDVGRTQEPIMEKVIVKDYVGFREDAKQGNGQENKSAPNDGQFFYDVEGIYSAYETQYNVQFSKDACIDDDDDDFMIDKENEIVKPDVDVHLFGISMDVPFENIGVTNLVLDDVLEGEDVDVINLDGFDSGPGNDNETSNYRRSSTAKKVKDIVYLHSIESRRNLKLYKIDSVMVRARCDGKVSSECNVAMDPLLVNVNVSIIIYALCKDLVIWIKVKRRSRSLIEVERHFEKMVNARHKEVLKASTSKEAKHTASDAKHDINDDVSFSSSEDPNFRGFTKEDSKAIRSMLNKQEPGEFKKERTTNDYRNEMASYRDFTACDVPKFDGAFDPIASTSWLAVVEGDDIK